MRCKSALLSLMFPGILVALPVLGGWLWAPQSHVLTTLLPTIAALLIVAALLVSWRFSCSRLVLLCVLLVVHECVLSGFIDLFPAWQLLLPVNLLLLSVVGERPVVSLAMLYRLGLIVMQPVVLFVLATTLAEEYQRLVALHWSFSTPFVPFPLNLSLYEMIVTLVALALLLRVVWRPSMESSVLLWALLLICTAQLPDVQARVPVVVLHGLLILIVLVSVFERSYTLAFRDELTGLPSRRAFLDFVNRRSSGYSLAIVDIDHFKKVNDTHGHDVGDQVLKRVAGRLAAVSNGGKAFRYGGEEFVVLFYRRDVERVNDALDLLRQSIADTPFVLRQKPRPEKRPRRVVATKDRQPSLRVTVSIGVSHWHKGADLDGVIKRADQALYKAKKTGRNRVVKG